MSISVAIYVRLSDEDRNKKFKGDESESIQNQKSMLTDFCRERNWEIYDIYNDEDYSGTDRNRPEFNRMIADCESGRVTLVLCKHQDRFARDNELVNHYIHDKFLEWGVRFKSVIDHIDTDNENTKKQSQILALTSEWYCEDTSKKIRSVLQHKREQGQFTGSFAPYGYAVDPKDKHHLVIDPVAADNVIPLIEKFRGQEKNRFKSIAIEAFYKTMGDPRIAKGSLNWHDVSESAIRIFRHWIAERDLDLFFKIIEATAVDSMWSNRKAYWKKYLPMMHNTWVFFGRDAMKYVRGLKNKALAYGELKHGSVDQSVFAFQIENYTFVEFSHNGSLRVWLIDDAPEIFGEESVDAGEIRSDYYPVKGKVPHLGDWQLKVDDWMYKNCHLKK